MTHTSTPSAPWEHLPQPYRRCLAQLQQDLGLEGADLGIEALRLTGPKPKLCTPLPIAECMAMAMSTAAMAATAFGRLRGIATQSATLGLKTAQAFVHAEHMFGPTLNGRALASRLVRDNPLLATPYRTKDGVWLMPSALHPQQQLAWLRFLAVPPDAAAVAHSIGRWQSGPLEDAAAAAGLAAALCRTQAQWRSHPQGKLLLAQAPVTLRTLGHAPALAPLAAAERPLSGVRVLAITQGVAGPIACRTLAEQGAQVVHLGHPEGFEHEAVWCEGYVGSRSMGLNLAAAQDRAHADALLHQCDVVLLGLRPRAQRALALGPEALLRAHPHVVQVRLSAYGATGPWADRPGFDMNAMAATGMMLQQQAYTGADRPELPPTVLLNDFLMGYLAAAGACAALRHRAVNGEVHEVQCSLAAVAMWCQAQHFGDASAALDQDEAPLNIVEGQTPLGLLRRLAPGVQLSGTPGCWRTPWLEPRVSLAAQSTWPS